MSAVDDSSTRKRVSIFARIVPALALIIVALGSAGTAFYIRATFWAMRDAEAAGVGAVAGALAEANLFVLIALYLAIVLGFAAIIISFIRLFVDTKTSEPSFWFFVGISALSFPAPLLAWAAESMIIRALSEHTNIMEAAYTINLVTLVTVIAAPFLSLLLLVAPLLPFSSNRTRKWVVLVGVLAIELALIIFAVVFQVRTSWLYQVKEVEHF